jgi:REP element-mobilizing transposase RayT
LRPIDDCPIYHVINRGNNRHDVFPNPADFQAFLAALADLKQRKPFELYGYCLLNNHFHLPLRPTGATISRRGQRATSREGSKAAYFWRNTARISMHDSFHRADLSKKPAKNLPPRGKKTWAQAHFGP